MSLRVFAAVLVLLTIAASAAPLQARNVTTPAVATVSADPAPGAEPLRDAAVPTRFESIGRHHSLAGSKANAVRRDPTAEAAGVLRL
jgi:hypothetical protein